MKNIIFVGLFCISSLISFAQVRKPDFLFKKDKTTIEAIIVQIDEDEIKYRKFANPQGPIFGVKRTEIIKIVYSNGETEMINGKSEKMDKPSKTASKPKDAPKKDAEKSQDKVAKTEKSESTQKASRVAPSNSDGGGMKFAIGLRGGVNLSSFSNLDADPGMKIQQLLGYHGGIVMELGGKTFAVQPEILYSQIGAKANYTADPTDPTDENGTFKVTGNTVTVPILLKAKFGGENLKFFVNAGPYGSYMLDSRLVITSGSTTVLDQKTTFTDNKGRIMYGVMGGAGIEMGLGAAKLLIEGRYMYGLGDNSEKVAGSTTKDSFPRNIMGSVGILFPLGK